MRLLDAYLEVAAAAGASDLHLEPGAGGLLARMRVDGRLRRLEPPPPALIDGLRTRARLLAGVDLADRRIPQDGRFVFRSGHRTIDVRAAFIPVYGGEKITLRLLDRDQHGLALDDLGLTCVQAAALRRAMAEAGGMIVVCGPTGAGKTTTLYAVLEELRRPDLSLLSVEDPVERRIDLVAQVPVDEENGRTFAVALRHALRQDPDVLMIGEMRDEASARIACRAALTGHLVLSTVHASHTREAIVRIAEMGVPRYLVSATVRLVLAQRLLRRPCPQCRLASEPSTAVREVFATAGLSAPARLASARGCRACGDSGYQGRTAVFELRRTGGGRVDEVVGPKSLWLAGLERAAGGDTTVAEVFAHCPQDSP